MRAIPLDPRPALYQNTDTRPCWAYPFRRRSRMDVAAWAATHLHETTNTLEGRAPFTTGDP